MVRIIRPGYANYNQNQKNQAIEIFERKRNKIIQLYIESNNIINKPKVKLIGEFHDFPDSDILYEKPVINNL